MRLQFSVLHLLELIAIIGLTITLDRWVIENAEDRDAAAREILTLWGSVVGVYLAVRNLRRFEAPLCGFVALCISVPLVIVNGGLIAYLSPGVFLLPSPANPHPLTNVDHSEFGRSVVIAALVAGVIAAVSALLIAGYLRLVTSVGRQP